MLLAHTLAGVTREPLASTRSCSRLILTSTLLLSLPAAANADGAYLVRDIDLTREPYFIECQFTCPPSEPIHGSLLSDLTPLGDRILFVANDRIHGFAPWVSDGSEEGTVLLADLRPNEQEAYTTILGTAGDAGLFWVSKGGDDDLWLTDGTPSGTAPLAMPCDPSCSRWDERGWTFEDQLFFTAYDGQSQHTKLYRFDAAARSTHQVFDQCAGSGFCVRDVLEMVSWNGELYFNVVVHGFASTAVRLHRLPSPAGTPVAVAGACSWNTSLLPFGSQLLFVGNCGGAVSQRSLFSLDAPDAAPRLLHAFADAGRLLGWGPDRAAFTAGGALWVTDGTAAGTAPAGFEQALAFVVLGDDLLVQGVRAGVTGLYALHRSGEATLLRTGTIETGPQVAGGAAFFAAEMPGLGTELWVTNGTPGGTHLYQDIAAGAASSHPGSGGLGSTGFVAAGDRTFFAASDPQHDVELWAAPIDGSLPPPPCVTSAEVLCLGERFRAEVAWKDFSGNSGRGHAVALPGVTGAFWFFDSSNLELMLKVLDGRLLNGHHWVFYGALSNVEYTLTVTDTTTGRQWTHHNPSGHFASGADTSAFP
jgi:ELWxxDGT repeat protein